MVRVGFVKVGVGSFYKQPPVGYPSTNLTEKHFGIWNFHLFVNVEFTDYHYSNHGLNNNKFYNYEIYDGKK